MSTNKYPLCHGTICNGLKCPNYLTRSGRKVWCELYNDEIDNLHLGWLCEQYQQYEITITIKANAKLLKDVETPELLESVLRRGLYRILNFFGKAPEVSITYKKINHKK